MAIKIEMLRSFSAVAQTGNLADAAVQMGRTQSALSMTLKQLEEHLGQRLFEGERKNRLTPLGEEVFELAKQQLWRFDETINAIEASAGASHGLLRIASIPSVAGLVFPPAISEFSRRHPEVIVELRDTDTEHVIDALLRGQADLGVASGSHTLNGIRQDPLLTDSFGLLMSKEHRLASQKAPPDIEDIIKSGFVFNRLCNLIDAPDIRDALSTAKVSVHNTLSLIGMVRSGEWVTILPDTVVRILPRELVFREVQGLSASRLVTLLTREGSRQSDLVEEFRDILTQLVQDDDGAFPAPQEH